MAFNLELWIIIGIFFALFVFGLFFLSSIEKQKDKRRRSKSLKPKEQKNWKEAALRLEKHVVALRKENVDWQKQVKILEKQADIYKQKNGTLKEKLKRESGWQQKEAEVIKKKNERLKELEKDFRRVEQDLEREHSQLVIFRRENEELKSEVESESEEIRALKTETEKAKAQSEAYRKEILDLRAENKKLAKRHEDVQWIAKSVHDKVKEELRQKVQEIEQLKKRLDHQ